LSPPIEETRRLFPDALFLAGGSLHSRALAVNGTSMQNPQRQEHRNQEHPSDAHGQLSDESVHIAHLEISCKKLDRLHCLFRPPTLVSETTQYLESVSQ
jgi:hypothetical protein